MSRRFTLSSPATLDLDEILGYVLGNSGELRAAHVAEGFFEAFQKLADNPGLGRWALGIGARTLRLPTCASIASGRGSSSTSPTRRRLKSPASFTVRAMWRRCCMRIRSKFAYSPARSRNVLLITPYCNEDSLQFFD